jgi:hypothetical protein
VHAQAAVDAAGEADVPGQTESDDGKHSSPLRADEGDIVVVLLWSRSRRYREGCDLMGRSES